MFTLYNIVFAAYLGDGIVHRGVFSFFVEVKCSGGVQGSCPSGKSAKFCGLQWCTRFKCPSEQASIPLFLSLCCSYIRLGIILVLVLLHNHFGYSIGVTRRGKTILPLLNTFDVIMDAFKSNAPL